MNRGSEWRIWDLHFHTPSSYDYKNKSISNKRIIDILAKNNVSVIAITDHHRIDVDRIKELQNLGHEQNITVLPGIEFCSELGGSESIHFIGIFSEKSNIETIWTKIQGNCNLTQEDRDCKGEECIVCSFEQTCKLIISLGGIITIHAGSKSNSVEKIKNNLLCKQEYKQKILSDFSPLLEVGKESDIQDYIEHVFPNIKFSLPIIMCSDNHNIEDYVVKSPMWIKADPTFEGLKQILYEPEERVRIQPTKPDEKDLYQVIDYVELKENGFWDNKIPFSPNLNTIIGGRSTGKSSLLKAIAGKHSIKNIDDLDYIKDHLNNVNVIWNDNTKYEGHEIEYFPQNYMHEIAGSSSKLNIIIGTIIKNKGKNALIEDYETSLKNIRREISEDVYSVFQKHVELVQLKSSLEEYGKRDGVVQQLVLLKEKSGELQNLCALSQEDSSMFDKYIEDIKGKNKLIEIIDSDLKILNSLSNYNFFESNFEWNIDSLLIEQNREELLNRLVDLKKETNEKWKKIICEIIVRLDKSKNDLVDKINVIKNNEIYLKGKSVYENNKELNDINNKIKDEEKKLTNIDNIQKQLELGEKYKSELIDRIITKHCSYKSEIFQMCKNLEISYDGLDIYAVPSFDEQKFKDFLELRFNLRGSVRQNYIYSLIHNYNNDNQCNALFLLQKLLNDDDVLKGGYTTLDVANEFLTKNWYTYDYILRYQNDDFKNMSEGKRAFVILKLLLDFSDKKCPILIDQPEDSLDNRAIYNELVTYIKNKKKQRQIILVTHNSNVVVSADAENIIVANQEGNNSKNQNKCKFQYVNGSLENTKVRDNTEYVLLSQGIREHICEILEGGRNAFEKREQKYGFKR